MGDENPFSGVRLSGVGLSSQSDLLTAMRDFGQSVNQLQLQRTLQGANDQVDQIRQSEASDAEKNSAFHQVAQHLTLGLAGNPIANQAMIQHVTDSFAPKAPQIQSGLEAYVYGTPEQKANAKEYLTEQENQKQREFDQSPDTGPTRGDINAYKQFVTSSEKTGHEVNAGLASSRSQFGQVSGNIQKLQDLQQGILNTPADKLTALHYEELASGVDRVFGGGVATISGVSNKVPDVLATKLARLKEIASSKPTSADLTEYKTLYSDVVNRLAIVNQEQQNNIIRRTLRGKLEQARFNGRDYSGNQVSGIDSISNHAENNIINPDGTRETAKLVNGRVQFASDQKTSEIKQALKGVYDNPDYPGNANIIRGISNDPYEMTTSLNDPKFNSQLAAMRKKYGITK